MQAGTDLILYRLIWVTELLYLSPYVRHGAGFYEWAARHGYDRQIYRLENQALAERQRHRTMGKLVKLTDQGRSKIPFNIDPTLLWNRDWDGQWEMALFDIPEAERKIRNRLRNQLKVEKFGQLQKSVWLKPSGTPSGQLQKIEKTTTVGVLQLITAQIPDRSQREIVKSAWDWDNINETIQDYRKHLKILKSLPSEDTAQGALHEWFLEEFARWKRWMDIDPLLPMTLLPSSYRGPAVWKEKRRTMQLYIQRCHPEKK